MLRFKLGARHRMHGQGYLYEVRLPHDVDDLLTLVGQTVAIGHLTRTILAVATGAQLHDGAGAPIGGVTTDTMVGLLVRETAHPTHRLTAEAIRESRRDAWNVRPASRAG